MKILIAPDSFKGSLTAEKAAQAINAGILRVIPNAECFSVPMADGGEGTASVLVSNQNGYFLTKDVIGPLGEKVAARYGVISATNTAVIEMAEAAGLALVVNNKQAMQASTYGVGELILDAIAQGVKKIIIGVGGSATTDAGMGMAQALGVKFFNQDHRIIDQLGCGAKLADVVRVDISAVPAQVLNTEIVVACDVSNVLFGEYGAAHMFAGQKGATPEMIAQLDKNLQTFAEVISRDVGKDLKGKRYGGAAGGLAAGLFAFADANLASGVDSVMQTVGLAQQIEKVDLVVTGEGQVDAQTAYGKVPSGVARLAKHSSVPVIVIGGGLTNDARELFDLGVDGLEASVALCMSIEDVIGNASDLLEQAAERAIRLVMVGRKM